MPRLVYNPDGFNIKVPDFDFAEKELRNRICKRCLKSLKQGFEEVNWDDGEVDYYDINSPFDTDCGAEWQYVEDDNVVIECGADAIQYLKSQAIDWNEFSNSRKDGKREDNCS